MKCSYCQAEIEKPTTEESRTAEYIRDYRLEITITIKGAELCSNCFACAAQVMVGHDLRPNAEQAVINAHTLEI